MLVAEADHDGDGLVSRFELLLTLPLLVRPAHWHDGLAKQIVGL